MDTRRRRRASALHEVIANHLRQRVLAHELMPGAVIDETALASFYGVPRSPVREAVDVLIAEGLACTDDAGTARVVRLSEAEGRDALALRSLLREQLALRRASPAGSGETLRRLLDVAERYVRLALGPEASA